MRIVSSSILIAPLNEYSIATEFYPSNDVQLNLQTTDIALLSAYLTTDSQITDGYSILEE